jgi:hypothetical protein
MLKIVIAALSFVASLNLYAIDYYRGDRDPPEVVKSAGGFQPRGYINNRPGELVDLSLFNHIVGQGVNSGYVSTTDSQSVALRFAGTGNGYVYVLAAAPNLVSASSALGTHYELQMEREFSAMGGIPWTQIRGWYRTVSGRITGSFVRNRDYRDDLYRNLDVPGPQDIYHLAGFPPGHIAWQMPPWNRYDPAAACVGYTRARDNSACLLSESRVAWLYLSKIRNIIKADKVVIKKGYADSSGLIFPQSKYDQKWVDIDGNQDLSLCGLADDAASGGTRITCLRAASNFTFKQVTGRVTDYGWSDGGRGFPVINGKAAYCRLVYYWSHAACAFTKDNKYFTDDQVSAHFSDPGTPSTRVWVNVFAGGHTALCRIVYARMRCDNFLGESTYFDSSDMGWTDSRIWLDIQGKGAGHTSFCRLTGTWSRLTCNVRVDDKKWIEVTGAYRDSGFSDLRYAVNMSGRGEEYCAVTGSAYRTLTCSYVDENNNVQDYSTPIAQALKVRGEASFKDVDGDGLDDLCYLSGKSLLCYLNQGRSFGLNTKIISLSATPSYNFSSENTKIISTVYKNKTTSAICYNKGAGIMRCDTFMIY